MLKGMDQNRPHRRRQFLWGVRDQLPILLGVIPFGLIFGALAVGQGLSPVTAQGFSVFVFAGSAQFIAVQLIGAGTPACIIVLTIFVVNLRHALYSATMAPYLRRLNRLWRWALSWLLTDEAFATSSLHFRGSGNPSAHWYLLGAGLALWSSWQVSTAAGIAVGAAVPPAWNLEFALPLTFLALLMPRLMNRPMWAAATSAGLASVALHQLPYGLGLLAGAMAGITVGLLIENDPGGTEAEP